MSTTRSTRRGNLARRRRSPEHFGFLPEGAKLFLRRRAVELGGVAVLVVAIAFALALATYSAADPSLNNATAAPVSNWLGRPGAIVADIVLQTLGIGGTVLVLALAAWGWRLLSHRGLPWFWLHLAVLPVTLMVAALFAATLAPPSSWPLPAGLGGVLGDMLLDAVRALGALFHWTPPVGVLMPAAGGLTLILLPLCLGLGRDDGATVARWLWRALAWLGAWLAYFSRRAAFGIWDGLRDAIAARRQHRLTTASARREPVLARPAPAGAVAGRDQAPGKAAPQRPKPERLRPRVERPGRRPAAPAPEPHPLPAGPAPGLLPPLDLLTQPPASRAASVSDGALEENARRLEAVLDDFGVRGAIIQVRPGPVVTLYELEPAPGIKSSRVINLADDIARSMSAISARVAVIPGRNAIGIELPNETRETVFLRELLATPDHAQAQGRLALALGKTIGGAPVIGDLARMPHLLIAGTTGSGKSVAVNAMILSLLYRLSPEECRLILIDPKMLELSVYDDIPHLLTPVVTDPRKAVVALKWTVREMEDRYRKMSKLGVRNIQGYNRRLEEARARGEILKRTVQTGFDPETGGPVFEEQEMDLGPMPFIVVVVDEMADLMMVAGKDIEGAIQRLAQMARAAGIHLIMATQRPSVDVITGTIKANFPTRISFQVTSKIDSRTILGEQGAEQLLGQGDMLYMVGGGRISRVHGPFVSDEEVEAVARFLRGQGAPDYVTAVTEEPDEGFSLDSLGGGEGESDELYDRAVAVVVQHRKASTSFVQRQLQIGYNRAARLIERMEQEGVIGPANHVGKREILVGEAEM